MTLVEALERNAADYPDKTALVYHDEKLNYYELNCEVNRLAHFLLKNGMGKGDRVGLVLSRVPELVIGFLAAAKAHGVAVPVNYELPSEGIKDILSVVSPSFLIVQQNHIGHIINSLPQNHTTKIIVARGEGGNGHIAWSQALNNGAVGNPLNHINDDEIVYLNYTSGSTGDSKGAITTHANIYWNTAASIDALGLVPEDILLCMFAPFAHPHEIFARPLYLGGTMVLLDNVYPKSLAETIEKNRVTCMMGLAPMYENLLEVLGHKLYDIKSLRIAESGGMHTRFDLIERFRQKAGVPILPVWGSTETTGIAIANSPSRPVIPGSLGRPCKSYEVKIVDGGGQELPAGEIGEMIFKGPAVIGGYYKDSIKYKSCFNDGWYYSGDLGKADEEGNFYFVERKSGMMKVAGLKVYPMEIELIIHGHPAVKEVAVIPVRDRLRGEIPKAIIVVREGMTLTEADVLKYCREHLPHYKVPRIVEIRQELPKIGSGKINKKQLCAEHV